MEHVRRKGLRFTNSRLQVLKAIYDRHDHFEVNEVYLDLKRKDANVSRASVYRTIPLLLEAGLIRESIFTDKHKHYEHVLGHKHHEHLICEKCGKVIEFEDSNLEQALAEICRKRGFEINTHKIEVTGRCRNCKHNRRKKKRIIK